MELHSLRINQLSAEAWSWYQDYLRALDAYDLERYAGFLADDVTIRFNNDAPMIGRTAATDGLGRFWSSVHGLGFSLVHEPLNIYGTDHALVLEALNHYEHPGQHRLTVRAAAFTDRGQDGLVSSVRLYQDLSALFDA